MDSKVIIGIIIVLGIAVAGYFFWLRTNPGIESIETSTTTSESSSPDSETESEANEIRSDIVGNWRSDDDAKFTREFSANGTVTDRYEGDASATITGTWTIVTDSDDLPAALSAMGDVTVVKVQFPEEVLYFSIDTLTSSDLTMLYLGSNSTLRFSRISQ